MTLSLAQPEFFGRCKVLGDLDPEAIAFGAAERPHARIYFPESEDLAQKTRKVKKLNLTFTTVSEGAGRSAGPTRRGLQPAPRWRTASFAWSRRCRR